MATNTLGAGECAEQATGLTLNDRNQVPEGGQRTAAGAGSSPREAARREGKRMRANITLATLNINGRSSADESMRQKWNHIHFLVKDKRIGILAIQETHLTQENLDILTGLYGKRLAFFTSNNPENRNSAGVAFIVNKELVNVKDIYHREIIPGRAACLSIHWQDGEKLTIMNVYAPNTPVKTRSSGQT